MLFIVGNHIVLLLCFGSCSSSSFRSLHAELLSVWHRLQGLACSKSLLVPSTLLCIHLLCSSSCAHHRHQLFCGCSLEGLPDYIMAQVLSHLSHRHLAYASSVCTILRDQAQHIIPGLDLHLYPHQVITIRQTFAVHGHTREGAA